MRLKKNLYVILSCLCFLLLFTGQGDQEFAVPAASLWNILIGAVA